MYLKVPKNVFIHRYLSFENVIQSSLLVVIFEIEKIVCNFLNIFMRVWKLNIFRIGYSCVK